MITLKPELQAQLADYAAPHGQNAAAALDEVLTTYLAWERQDFEEAVEGIRRGMADVETGRTRPADQFLTEVRRKYGFPG